MNDHRKTCTYHLVRYVPDLLRDEWINVGVLLHDRARNSLRCRFLEEPAEMARLRRLHPEADQQVLRSLPAMFDALLASPDTEIERLIEKLDSTLSNVLQLSPQRAVLSEDTSGEVDRIYAAQVAPPASRSRESAMRPDTRAGLHARASESFRRAGILTRLERGVRAEPFTFRGDTFRIDYAYRSNGTRGFIQALPLLRDAHLPKSLAFTAERVRAQAPGARFHAISEDAPWEMAERYRSVVGFLREQQVEVVPLAELAGFTERLRGWIH
jgi:hypothetical protein